MNMENLNDEFGKGLEDLGWQRMEDLLDREMPVSPVSRRRPFLGWWFLLPIGLLIGAVSVWNHANLISNKPSNSKQAPKEIIASADNQPLSGTAIPQVEKAAPASLLQNMGNHLPVQSSTSKSVHPVITQDQPILHNAKTSAANQSNNQFLYNSTNTSTLTQSAASTQATLNESTTFTDTKSQITQTVITQPDGLQNTSAQAAQSLGAEQPLSSNQPSITSNQPSISKNQKLFLGVSAAIQTRAIEKLDGFTAGLNARFELSKKWSVQAGLNYARYNSALTKASLLATDKYSQSAINSDSEFSTLGGNIGYPDSTIGVLSFYQNADGTFNYIDANGVNMQGFPGTSIPNTIIEPKEVNVVSFVDSDGTVIAYADSSGHVIANQRLKNLHYLTLPLSVGYRVHPRWTICLGLMASALVRTAYEIPDHDGTIVHLNKTQHYFSYKDAGLHLFDASALIGVSWSPLDHFSLDIRYQHGLLNIVSGTSNSKAYNRFLSLGGTYWF